MASRPCTGSPNESDRQTAQIAADVLGVRPRIDADLRELDYGLWQGLLVEDVKQRHARAYRQWMEAPTSVCPPEGETLEEAAKRLDGALQRILKRQRGRTVLLVVHPVAAGLLRCRLAGSDLSNIWDCVNWPGAWEQYDTAPPARPRETKT